MSSQIIKESIIFQISNSHQWFKNQTRGKTGFASGSQFFPVLAIFSGLYWSLVTLNDAIPFLFFNNSIGGGFEP